MKEYIEFMLELVLSGTATLLFLFIVFSVVIGVKIVIKEWRNEK